MSEWAYKNCPGCNNRIHINFTCTKCGGDPWGVISSKKKHIDELQQEKDKLEKEVSNINHDIILLKKDIDRLEKYTATNTDTKLMHNPN